MREKYDTLSIPYIYDIFCLFVCLLLCFHFHIDLLGTFVVILLEVTSCEVAIVVILGDVCSEKK